MRRHRRAGRAKGPRQLERDKGAKAVPEQRVGAVDVRAQRIVQCRDELGHGAEWRILPATLAPGQLNQTQFDAGRKLAPPTPGTPIRRPPHTESRTT